MRAPVESFNVAITAALILYEAAKQRNGHVAFRLTRRQRPHRVAACRGLHAARGTMRPQTLDEFIGQEDLIGQGRPLRRAIEGDRLQSIILWGPPEPERRRSRASLPE